MVQSALWLQAVMLPNGARAMNNTEAVLVGTVSVVPPLMKQRMRGQHFGKQITSHK